MRHARAIFLWIGLAIAIVGTGQFFLVVALSADPITPIWQEMARSNSPLRQARHI
jgi:hypothetical protein